VVTVLSPRVREIVASRKARGAEDRNSPEAITGATVLSAFFVSPETPHCILK